MYRSMLHTPMKEENIISKGGERPRRRSHRDECVMEPIPAMKIGMRDEDR